MKLNIDCIRDLLLLAEEQPLGKELTLPEIESALSQYTKDEIVYSCLKLDEAGFIILATVSMIRSNIPAIRSIKDITYAGHQFLENIRNDKNWEKTKSIAKEIGSFSLDCIKDVAANVVTSLIKAHF